MRRKNSYSTERVKVSTIRGFHIHSSFPVKAKLFKWFRGGNAAPGVVRLGFHDCLKYKDGTGGCDGCLNWHGMEVYVPLS